VKGADVGSGPPSPCLAVLCDAAGRVMKILRNDVPGLTSVELNRLLTGVFDPGSYGKALRFLGELRGGKAASDWQLNVATRNRVITLHFFGAPSGDQLLIIGACTSQGAMRLFDEIMRMNNEHVNALRSTWKDSMDAARRRAEKDQDLYEELARLNNELANLQRQITKKNQELERLDALKNQFLGMVAHDLHHPTGIIQMYSEFLIEEAADRLSPEHREFLDIIRASSDAMHQMIADFLDIAKIESGRLTLNLETVDIGELVQRNVARNVPFAAKKGIDLIVDGSPPKVSGEWDRHKIDQVLDNLISNALKYSEPSTRVAVSVSIADAQAVISVADQGVGIPEDQMERIFKPFQRVASSRPQAEKSSGLGLTIVHKIVAAHGGRVQVESRVGEGSVFKITLPLAGPSPEQAPVSV